MSFPATVAASLPALTASVDVVLSYPPPNHYPLYLREFQADFAQGRRDANLSITKRPDAVTFDYLSGFTLGPVAIGDVTLGIVYRPWYVRASNDDHTVYVARANDDNTAWLPEVALFSFFDNADIDEVDFAFEQAGRPVVCAERTVAGQKEIWLYWFKPFLDAFIFEKLANGRTPRVVLDNPPDNTNSDVELFYLKTGAGLILRVQREAYAVENVTPHLEEVDWYVEDTFYTSNWRVAVILVKHDVATGKYSKKRIETKLMPVFLGRDDNNMAFTIPTALIDDRETLFLANNTPDGYKEPMELRSLDNSGLLISTNPGVDSLYQEPLFLFGVDDREVLKFWNFTRSDGSIDDNYKEPMSLTSLDDRQVLFFVSTFDKDSYKQPMTLTSIDDS